MTTSELKKFISGFLLSAVGVAASAFLFLNQAAQSVNEPAAQQVSDTAPTTPTNAFQEPLPPEATPPAPTGQPPVNLLADTLGTSTATDTLTARLIIALGQEISRTNPNGPTVVDGESGIASPDINSIIAAVTQDPSITKVKIPDWESEIVFKYQPHVIAGANPSDIANYKKEIGDFYQRYSETSVPTPDPTSLTPFDPTSLPIPQALADAQSIPTPEPFAKLQWDLIKTIAYQNKAIDLIKIADTDPVGASVIMQVQEANYLATLDDLQQESQKAVALGILPGEAPLPGIVSLVNGLLGIKTAHAQFEVNDLTKLARNIWQYIKKFITAKLKDLLVHKLVMQTIQWIQGGGKPQFVTNWKGFMENTAKNAAGQMIDQIYPKLCTSFAPLIRVAAIPVNPSRDLNTLPVCTIDRVVQNVQNFARSFETGGWIAYGAAMQPSNNLIGSIVQSKMLVDLEAEKAAQAAQSETKSGKGAISQKDCVQQTDSPYDKCLDSVYEQCADQRMTIDECDDTIDDLCTGLSQEGTCTEYKNTTPGDMLIGAMSDSGRSSLERVVNAKDFVALINTLINAMMSKLVKLGQNAVSKGFLGLNPADAYVPPPQGGGGSSNGSPPPTMPEIPGLNDSSTQSMGGEFCASTTATQYRDAVVSAVNSYSSANPTIMTADGSCNPNWKVIGTGPNDADPNGFVPKYLAGVAAALQSAGFQVSSGADEVGVKKDNNCSEQFDIETSAGCANAKFLYGISPAEF